MARIARAVATGSLHHIIQRGNRRQKTFSMGVLGYWYGIGVTS
jgi:REP element-mobilizing transposase RayT